MKNMKEKRWNIHFERKCQKMPKFNSFSLWSGQTFFSETEVLQIKIVSQIQLFGTGILLLW